MNVIIILFDQKGEKQPNKPINALFGVRIPGKITAVQCSNFNTEMMYSTLFTGLMFWESHLVTQKEEKNVRQRHHKAHLHWQKPKSKKPWFFVVPFTLPEKPITFGVFGTKSACAKKPESHTCVVVSGAHARLLSTFDRTRVVRITSRAAVG